MSLLQTRSLRAFYGDFQALFDIDVTVDEGDTIAVIGANGAGKTTFLRAVAGVLPCGDERVMFDGRPIGGLSAHEIVRLGIAMVPEGRRLFPSLSVEENLLLGAHSGRTGAWTLARVYEVFPLLEPLRHRLAGRLSGGEQQMLAIARTLMGNPVALLLDEPSEGLAPIVVQRIAEILHRLRGSGASILIAEQNMHFCLGIASDATVIDKGQIVYRDTIARLKANTEIRSRYLAI